MLDTRLPTFLIERMFAARFSLPAGKQPIREFLAVVRQYLDGLDRTSLVQGVEK